MVQLTCIITFFCTVLIPLRLTYKALKKEDKQLISMFGLYWTIFTILRTITYHLSFLQWYPIEWVWTILMIWLYHKQYMGALFLRDLILQIVNGNKQIKDILQMIKGKIAILGVFQVEAQKPKSQ